MNEVKAPSTSRQSLIATAGTRAFRKLPRATRAAAATALLAWAKAHIHSPAFKASYCRLPERPDAKRPGSMFAPGLAKALRVRARLRPRRTRPSSSPSPVGSGRGATFALGDAQEAADTVRLPCSSGSTGSSSRGAGLPRRSSSRTGGGARGSSRKVTMANPPSGSCRG